MATPTHRGSHTQECFEALLKREGEREAFFAEHVGACQACDASGLIGGSVDPDTGFSDEDACEDCLIRGKCPVCSGPLTPIAEFTEGDKLEIIGYEDARPCGHDVSTLQAPPVYECLCWVTEADRLLDEAKQIDAMRR